MANTPPQLAEMFGLTPEMRPTSDTPQPPLRRRDKQWDRAPIFTMANSISQGAIANIMAGSTGANGYNPVVQVRTPLLNCLLTFFQNQVSVHQTSTCTTPFCSS